MKTKFSISIIVILIVIDAATAFAQEAPKVQEMKKFGFGIHVEQFKTQDIMLFQLKLKADHNDKCNYMIYFRFKNVLSGTFKEFEFNEFNPGGSYGEIVGAFSGIAQFMFDLEKVNEMFKQN